MGKLVVEKRERERVNQRSVIVVLYPFRFCIWGGEGTVLLPQETGKGTKCWFAPGFLLALPVNYSESSLAKRRKKKKDQNNNINKEWEEEVYSSLYSDNDQSLTLPLPSPLLLFNEVTGSEKCSFVLLCFVFVLFYFDRTLGVSNSLPLRCNDGKLWPYPSRGHSLIVRIEKPYSRIRDPNTFLYGHIRKKREKIYGNK